MGGAVLNTRSMVNQVNVIQMQMQTRKVRAAPYKVGVGILLLIVHALDAQTSEKVSLMY